MYEEGRGETNDEQSEEGAQEKSTISGGARVKLGVRRPVFTGHSVSHYNCTNQPCLKFSLSLPMLLAER